MFNAQEKNTRPMLQESSTDVAIIISFYYTVDVACNMMLILRWEFSILEPNVRVFCIHIVLMQQIFIFDFVNIIYQCCDGLPDEKILIGCSGARSAELFNT